MNQRDELVHQVVWDGTRTGQVGSPSANRDLLFWEPAYAEEEDPPAVRVIVRKPLVLRADSVQRQDAVLTVMGTAWIRPCTVARKMGVSSDTAWWTLRQLAQAGAVECRNTVEPRAFSRGVRWYRRVRACT